VSSFLETLNYSSSNEDSHSELKALNIDKNDSILCITGSGGRPLDLLIKNPTKIVSIDFNPCQNYLLELKMVAIQHLEYQESLEFLGVRPSQKRIHVFNKLKQSLSSDARDYWVQQTTMIEKGVIYQGRWEKYFSNLARIVGIIRKKRRLKLFNSKTIQDQAKIWNDNWDNLIWRLFLRFISSRFTWKRLFGDPGFYLHVPAQFSIYTYLRDRFSSAFNNILVHQSPFATLLFFGKYEPEVTLPTYLQEEHYKTLRDNLSCIQIITQPLSEYLDYCGKETFQKYSLSDFSSYTHVDDYSRIWKGIIKTASAGAIICERQFLVKRDISQDLRTHITRISELEKELMDHDDSIFYTFVIAKIN
jgi:S-adenosylmethionine-diacylglycerol 3-amino-3-carboxypropyl transferase